MDTIYLTCLSCGHKGKVVTNTPSNAICLTCGGSIMELSTDSGAKQYELKCAKCSKSFFISIGESVDIRSFKHCNVHLFSFHESLATQDKAKLEKVKTKQKKAEKPKEVLSLPFSAKDITNIREKIGKQHKKIIGIVYGNEANHTIYPRLDKLSDKLRDKYFILPFRAHNLSQDEWLTLNECDLVIGQYTFTVKHALMLHIPTVILHTGVKLSGRCEASLYGLIPQKIDSLITHIDRILKRPLLTYCIVTYNRQKIAKQCIEAIIKWKKNNEDILIVDNNSTDGLQDWLVDLDKREYVTLILKEKNKGCVLGRNIAMRAARGIYLLTLDSDQIISADTTHIMRLQDADIVGSEAWDITRNGISAKVGVDSLKFDYVGAGGMMTQKRIAQSMDYFDERFAPAYYEDPDFCFRAREIGYTIKACDNHIRHMGPGMDKSLGDEAASVKSRSKDKFVDKWASKYKRHVTSSKPRILFLVDVPGWAWDIKTKNIKKWLESEYDIVIKYQHQIPEFINRDEEYDLYFAYDCVYVRKFQGRDSRRVIGGVTAHTYTNFPDYKELLESCGAVHANSMLLYNELKQINKNAFYVPNGVDIERFKYIERDEKSKFRAGYVGKSHDRKGYKNFIVPACKRADVELKAQTCKYNDDNKIDPYNMPDFYKNIDCVVIASDMDGTPNQLLEAAATGRTFVGVRIGNVPEFCDSNNGFMVQREVAAIADRLSWLKKHREESKSIGINARKTIESGWSWEIQARNYARMFEEILNKL